MNKQRMQQIVRAMVRTGYTDKQIAEELYITKAQVSRIRREIGLSKAKKDPRQALDRMVELYNKGYSYKAIGEEVGHSPDTVSLVLRENGYAEKKPKEPEPIVSIWPGRPVRKIYKCVYGGVKYYDITEIVNSLEGDSIWMNT